MLAKSLYSMVMEVWADNGQNLANYIILKLDTTA